MFEQRTRELQQRLSDIGADLALITDEDSIYYYSGYHSYLYMDFGRPTLLLAWRSGEVSIITPSMELEMAQRMSWVGSILPWQDGVGGEWRDALDEALSTLGRGKLGIEPDGLPPIVRAHLERVTDIGRLVDISTHVAEMRMVKSDAEIQLARHTAEVGVAMMEGGRAAIAEGVPEYEVGIATMTAGTRRAAALLSAHYQDPFMSPNAHFLPTLASGPDTTMPHHRASTKPLTRGDPVFLCLCGMANFHRFKLGFDRMFWVGEVGHPDQEKVYDVALQSQKAALATVRPGVLAEDVHSAYAEVIQTAGYEFPFRCGRATGFSFLEKPQLSFGDKTVLRPGMVLAVDGSVNVPGFFRAQVGDSVAVTDDGYELLTRYPKSIADMVVV